MLYTFLAVILYIIVLLMVVMFLYSLFGLIGTFSLAPYVASGKVVARKMVELGEVKEGMKIVELGSGNGEICIQAALKGATAIGIEINPILVLYAEFRAWKRGVSPRTHFTRQNVWTYRIPQDTDVVLLYGLPNKMTRIWNKMEAECRSGTKLISHAFTVPGIEPMKTDGNVRLYQTIIQQ